MSCKTLYRFLALCQNLEKTKDTIPRKHLGRQKNRRKGRRTDRRLKNTQTLFYRTPPATARVVCIIQPVNYIINYLLVDYFNQYEEFSDNANSKMNSNNLILDTNKYKECIKK